jgi:hypothetical protein
MSAISFTRGRFCPLLVTSVDDDSLDDEVKSTTSIGLDLSYMHHGIHPYLQIYHKKRFNDVLSKVPQAMLFINW